jgi:hypothetical protein
MTILSKIGLEAEFLLLNSKDAIIIPPASWDRDGFPLLGEIRGTEGKNVAETVTNFKAKEIEIVEGMRNGHTMRMSDVEMIKLALYKKANKEIDWQEKEESMGLVKNIHGIDIEDFSDQVVKNNKIQGIKVSCGLHVHFSCGQELIYEHQEAQYEQVILPLGITMGNAECMLPAVDTQAIREIMNPTLYLYRHKGYVKKKALKRYVSRLNKPAILYIIEEMDKAFFEKFAAPKSERTKFRQPGFFELKPYGFEYRSLPANNKTMNALPEITRKAFDLLQQINEY